MCIRTINFGNVPIISKQSAARWAVQQCCFVNSFGDFNNIVEVSGGEQYAIVRLYSGQIACYKIDSNAIGG